MDSILHLDQIVFRWINNDLSNPFFDWLLPVWRTKTTWIPLYLAALFFLIRFFKMKGLYITLIAIGVAGVCDFVSSSLIKPAVNRTRPCNDEALETWVIERIECGGGKSFPSSHATNHFGIAIFFMMVLSSVKTRWKLLMLFWAASIALSQVYVGVHYPIDILAGAILGSLIAFLLYRITKYFFPKVYDLRPQV
jgi:undecaprenyl-diphosphatase